MRTRSRLLVPLFLCLTTAAGLCVLVSAPAEGRSEDPPGIRESDRPPGQAADSVRFLDDRASDVGDAPTVLVTGRFNRDRRLDVATANAGGRSISILLQTQDGGLGDRRDIPVGGTPFGLAAADLNRDGYDDLGVVLVDQAVVLILLADGTGGFTEESRHPVGRNPSEVLFADLDSDGVLDMACTNAGDSSLSLFRGTPVRRGEGGALFEAWPPCRAPRGLGALVSADFNGDGIPDLAAAGNFVCVLSGRGGGEFGPPLAIRLDRPVCNVAATDFDSDGDLDLVAAVPVGFHLLENDSHGNFTARPRVEFGWDEQVWVAVADLDEDGDEDLLLTAVNYARDRSGFVAVSLNDHGTFGPVLYHLGRRGTRRVHAGDLNGDGHTDAVAINGPRYGSTGPGSSVSVFVGRGDGRLAGISRQRLPAKSGFGTRRNRLYALERAVEPHPRPPDLLMTTWLADGRSEARILRNLGNGRFSEPILVLPYSVIGVRDVTGDGISDVLCRLPDCATGVFVGDLAGGFTLTDQPCRRSGLTADIDGDGLPEMVFRAATDSLAYLPNLGGGRFGPETALPGRWIHPEDCLERSADLDGDGIEELLALRFERTSPDSMLWWLVVYENVGGRGYRAVATVEFQREEPYWANELSPSAIFVHANPREGTAEIAVLFECDCNSARANVFRRDRSGTYTRTNHLSFPGEWVSMAFTDLSGDGLPDLVAGPDDNADRGPLSVFHGANDGQLARQAEIPLDAEVSRMVATDVDVDGHPDLVVLSGQRGSISVLYSAAGERAKHPGHSGLDVPRRPGNERRAAPMLAVGEGTDASRLRFSMKTAGPAHLALYDLAGRRVISRDLGWLAAGDHTIGLPELATLRAGVYWLRAGAAIAGEVRKIVVMR